MSKGPAIPLTPLVTSPTAQKTERLIAEMVDLRACLEEASEVFRAIRMGEVDALLMRDRRAIGCLGSKVPMNPYRVLIGTLLKNRATHAA